MLANCFYYLLLCNVKSITMSEKEKKKLADYVVEMWDLLPPRHKKNASLHRKCNKVMKILTK